MFPPGSCSRDLPSEADRVPFSQPGGGALSEIISCPAIKPSELQGCSVLNLLPVSLNPRPAAQYPLTSAQPLPLL